MCTNYLLFQVLVMYNFVCCALSMYTLAGFSFTIFSYHSLFDKTPSTLLPPIFYMYWISKQVELLDTVFMILRHRRRQISFLHVYHHGSMLLLSDYSYRHTPWPTIGVFLGLNSFVHVLLYGYYGLSAMRPDNPPSWKQRLTEIQILQFVIDLGVAIPGYLYYGFCVYGIVYGLLMIGLFSNFYYQAYLRPKAKHKVKNGKNGKQA